MDILPVASLFSTVTVPPVKLLHAPSLSLTFSLTVYMPCLYQVTVGVFDVDAGGKGGY